jgi:hypothetical protein
MNKLLVSQQAQITTAPDPNPTNHPASTQPMEDMAH